MAGVELDRVTKRYGSGRPAVEDVSFTVEDGEFVTLLGPSGCGKSTTLRMIAGLEGITSGVLKIGGRVMNGVPAKDRDIAMVFQSYALYPHMTVARNLAFGLLRRSVAREEVERRVASAAAMLGLTDLLDRRPSALSGGQRQRVALGRAIVRDPQVYLFDEPLSNLDAALRASMRNEIVAQHRRLGTTMIYVTHDQVEAMTMSSRMCLLDEGRLVQAGPPLELYHQPASAFVARFLGSPPMNLIPVEAQADAGGLRLHLAGQEVLLPGRAAPGGAVLLGIRPERLGLADAGPAALACEVRSIEPLGAETVVFAAVGDHPVAARLPDGVALAPGDRVRFAFDPASAYLFDAATGRALPRNAP